MDVPYMAAAGVSGRGAGQWERSLQAAQAQHRARSLDLQERDLEFREELAIRELEERANREAAGLTAEREVAELYEGGRQQRAELEWAARKDIAELAAEPRKTIAKRLGRYTPRQRIKLKDLSRQMGEMQTALRTERITPEQYEQGMRQLLDKVLGVQGWPQIPDRPDTTLGEQFEEETILVEEKHRYARDRNGAWRYLTDESEAEPKEIITPQVEMAIRKLGLEELTRKSTDVRTLGQDVKPTEEALDEYVENYITKLKSRRAAKEPDELLLDLQAELEEAAGQQTLPSGVLAGTPDQETPMATPSVALSAPLSPVEEATGERIPAESATAIPGLERPSASLPTVSPDLIRKYDEIKDQIIRKVYKERRSVDGTEVQKLFDQLPENEQRALAVFIAKHQLGYGQK